MTTEAMAVQPVVERTSLPRRMLHGAQDYLVVWSLIVIFVALSIATSTFATPANLLNLADTASSLGLIAVGVTIVMVSGAFDLSVGAIFALAGVVAAETASVLSGPVALLAGVVTGTLAGAFNGALVSYARIHPILATLATTVVYGGVAVVISSGYSIQAQRADFTGLGTGRFLGVTYATWIFAAVAILATVLLRYTPFGRRVFASGSNPVVAGYAGIRPARVRFVAFMISGTTAALSGVLAASTLGQGQAGTGTGLELLAIAAIAVGGNSILGGEGVIWRTVIGVVFLRVLDNGFNLLGIDAPYRQMVTGLVIILAVALDVRARLKRGTLRL